MSVQTSLVNTHYSLRTFSGVHINFESAPADCALTQIVVKELFVQALLTILCVIVEVRFVNRAFQGIFQRFSLLHQILEVFDT